MDQVARRLTLVALNRRSGLQVSQSPEPQAVQSYGHGGEVSDQQPGDVAQVQALMPELHVTLQVLWIERPPLGAANTAAVRLCDCPNCSVAGQPHVGAAQGDPRFYSKFSQGAMVVQVLKNQSQPASLRHACVGVCMHGA